jgi:hypothetical protein
VRMPLSERDFYSKIARITKEADTAITVHTVNARAPRHNPD